PSPANGRVAARGRNCVAASTITASRQLPTSPVERGSKFVRHRLEPVADAGGCQQAVQSTCRCPSAVRLCVWRLEAMSTLTRKDVIAMLGELDDDVIAEIIASGATLEELAEAHAWLANDEPLMNAGRPLPSGRVARVVDIVAAISEEEEQEDVASRS